MLYPRNGNVYSDARGMQHGFYAEALRAHLRSLATGVGLGRISRSSDVARFVQGGVVKTFRCQTTAHSDARVSSIRR